PGRVVLTGRVPTWPTFLRAADLFAFPSEFEALGLSLIEACASGLPAGLSINSTGRINGTTTSLGNYNVNVNVSDGIVTSTVSFAWNVLPLSGNLAQGKPATSSSNETTAFTPNLAVDGVATTRWSSAYADPQWLQIDLGVTRNVTRVVLNWETAFGSAYSIQISNDAANWTTLFSTSTGDGGIDNLTGLSGVGRYVRMLGTTRATAWGYSLWEFEVYGGATTLTLNPVNSLPRPINTAINYTASSSGGVNVRYKWLWGDGSPETAYASSPNASHTYGGPASTRHD
ncbi:MAG: glycosyltransferase, partial [Anaerolineae bacterium]|nr:glycosyltransferase [Anaerolineae bacterium]